MRRIILLLTIFLSFGNSYAQEVGLHKFQNKSDFHIIDTVTQQEYTLQVFLPKDYSIENAYPVIYLFDADNSILMNFYLATIDALVYYNAVPNSIVVGINQIDRSKELGILKDSAANNFLNLVRNKITKKIDEKYATIGYNSYVGHSLGGQLLTYGYITYPEDFYSVINISPALLYPNASEPFNEKIKIPLNVELNKVRANSYYYCSVGNSGFQDSEFIKGVTEIEGIFESHATSSLNFKFDYLDGYTHGISPFGSLTNGLLFLFKDWTFTEDLAIEILLKGKIDGLSALERHIETIDEKYNKKNIALPDHVYDNLYINHFGKQEYQKAISIMLLKLKSSSDAETYLNIAEGYKKINNEVEYERYLKMSEELK